MLIGASWPHAPSAWIDADADAEMTLVIATISEGRFGPLGAQCAAVGAAAAFAGRGGTSSAGNPRGQ